MVQCFERTSAVNNSGLKKIESNRICGYCFKCEPFTQEDLLYGI